MCAWRLCDCLLSIVIFLCPSDEWLSLTSSLNGQDVQDGDTLLLRKKFFILNDDIHEAVKGNDDLRELIYQQVTMVIIYKL